MLRLRCAVSLCGILLALAPLAAWSQNSGVPGGMPGMNNGPVRSSASSSSASSANGVAPGVAGSDQQDSSMGAGPDIQAMRDKMFLRQAAEAGVAEVQLGQLAAQKGASDGVKRLGQRMAADGTSLQAVLKPFADTRGMKLPTVASKDALAEVERLSRLSGVEFDKQYLAYSHHEYQSGLDYFHREETTTGDLQLQGLAAQGEQVIGRRTAYVEKLSANVGEPATAHR